MVDAGIDYGGGMTNRNVETGIRYGAISLQSLALWVLDDLEPYYTGIEWDCADCHTTFELDDAKDDGHSCPECGLEADVWCDPMGYSMPDKDGYRTEYSEMLNCVFVLDSPYYTETVLCSPCAPGAGDLDSPLEGGQKSYCFGHEHFEDGTAPYPVYRVGTGELVLAPKLV